MFRTRLTYAYAYTLRAAHVRRVSTVTGLRDWFVRAFGWIDGELGSGLGRSLSRTWVDGDGAGGEAAGLGTAGDGGGLGGRAASGVVGLPCATPEG